VIPANIGVNPSLTITALAEHAMSHVPAVEGTVEAAETAGVRSAGRGPASTFAKGMGG
jgi:hypothetical protein